MNTNYNCSVVIMRLHFPSIWFWRYPCWLVYNDTKISNSQFISNEIKKIRAVTQIVISFNSYLHCAYFTLIKVGLSISNIYLHSITTLYSYNSSTFTNNPQKTLKNIYFSKSFKDTLTYLQLVPSLQSLKLYQINKSDSY